MSSPASKNRVVIRFAGDSGDGIQLTGGRFTAESAFVGNDLRTLPDFPAEIRAPAGTLAGVSSFQIQIGSEAVYTPGEVVDALVAMNPAALKKHLEDLCSGGILVVNEAAFSKRNLSKAGYDDNPLEGDALSAYQLHAVDISGLTRKALEDLGLSTKVVDRCKNFFALGLVFWLYSRDIERTLGWIAEKFGKSEELVEANSRALKAGYYYGETVEAFAERYEIPAAELAPGLYRNIAGNKALAMGFVAAAQKSGLDLFLASYPITPASDILHELSALKKFGVATFQAEDEIAAMGAAVGASYGGALAITSTSGPGLALKSEALGLAHMVELPVVVIDVQRAGPSTGMPTKTEQSDLLQAMYGRNGDSPVPVLAAATPGDCFWMAYEAARIALKYMTPVVLLSDGYVANGSEPWPIPEVGSLPSIEVKRREKVEGYQPYLRDADTLARPRVELGTPGLEHRIGGLEKGHRDGGVSYDPQNHERMVRLRHAKVARIAQEIPPTEVHGHDAGDLLLIGWGGTRGAIFGATQHLLTAGKKVASLHLRHLNPLPGDLLEIIARFERVAVAELNMGQLVRVLRAESGREIFAINKVRGRPFGEHELVDKANEILADGYSGPFLSDVLEGVA